MENEDIRSDIISIIIPCYNVEKYIDRCMESVLNQTYKNLEIILVDDGSTDGTGEICDRYSRTNTKIKVIHKKNGGLSSARNAGLEVASGNYIGFVDSDDWIDHDFYAYLYDLIVRYDADIAQCAYFLTNGNSKVPIIEEKIKKINKEELLDVFFRVNGGESNSSVWNRLYKREIIADTRFPDRYVNEDVFFSYFVFLRVQYAVISNAPKYLYFINEHGITRGALRKQDLSLYYVWDKVVEHTKEYNEQYYKKALLNRERAIFTLLSKYVVYGIEDEDIFTKEWIHKERGRLRKAYGLLISSHVLDIKRKIAITLVCFSPEMVRFAYIKLKRS